MNISLDKLFLYIIPYLIVISIFYNNGYWSSFGIDIFQYYQAQDILKGISIPFIKVLGVIIAPNAFAIYSIITWENHNGENKKNKNSVKIYFLKKRLKEKENMSRGYQNYYEISK